MLFILIVMNIDISSDKKFYNSYLLYFLDLYKINFTLPKIYKYVFFCRDSDEIYCIEGGSMEEIYYKILFKINYNSCDDILVYIDSEYTLDDLADPIQLLKMHYFEKSEYYIFEEIKFIKSDLENEIINTDKIKINRNSSEEFYASYKLYYQSKIISKIISKIKSKIISNLKYQYVLISKEFAEIYFIEGYSLEELYYIVFFKIDIKCWDNIYDSEYQITELKNPIKLFKKHFIESDEYIFEPISFI
jgi:hypothetical protein